MPRACSEIQVRLLQDLAPPSTSTSKSLKFRDGLKAMMQFSNGQKRRFKRRASGLNPGLLLVRCECQTPSVLIRQALLRPSASLLRYQDREARKARRMLAQTLPGGLTASILVYTLPHLGLRELVALRPLSRQAFVKTCLVSCPRSAPRLLPTISTLQDPAADHAASICCK